MKKVLFFLGALLIVLNIILMDDMGVAFVSSAIAEDDDPPISGTMLAINQEYALTGYEYCPYWVRGFGVDPDQCYIELTAWLYHQYGCIPNPEDQYEECDLSDPNCYYCCGTETTETEDVWFVLTEDQYDCENKQCEFSNMPSDEEICE